MVSVSGAIQPRIKFTNYFELFRIISSADYLATSNPLFAKLGILNVQDIYKCQLAGLMWDQDKGVLPKCFDNYFIKVNNVHTYGTRSAKSDKLSVNGVSTRLFTVKLCLNI